MGTDDEIKEHGINYSGNLSSFLAKSKSCSKFNDNLGTTSVSCCIIQEEDKKMLYVANCGGYSFFFLSFFILSVLFNLSHLDARAVLCRGGKAIRLTVDHKATDEEEVRKREELRDLIFFFQVFLITFFLSLYFFIFVPFFFFVCLSFLRLQELEMQEDLF